MHKKDSLAFNTVDNSTPYYDKPPQRPAGVKLPRKGSFKALKDNTYGTLQGSASIDSYVHRSGLSRSVKKDLAQLRSDPNSKVML